MIYIENIILFVFSACSITFSFLMFHFYPFRFVDLLSFYKMTLIPQKYLFIQIFAMILSTISLCIFPSLPYLPLAFLVPLLLFASIAQPHKKPQNNIRSIVNSFTMCTFIVFKICTETLPKTKFSQNVSISLFFCLVSLCIVSAIVSLIFHFLYFAERRKKER